MSVFLFPIIGGASIFALWTTASSGVDAAKLEEALLAEIDFRLAAPGRLRPSTLAAVTAVIVDIPVTLRGASAPSVAFALAGLIVMYAVARSVERLDRPLHTCAEHRPTSNRSRRSRSGDP